MSTRLGDIAEVIGAELAGDPDSRITGAGTLMNAGPGQLSFFANRRYAAYLKTTRAAAVVLAPADAADCPVTRLIARDPYLAYAKAVRYLNPEPAIRPGIDPAACISDTASIHPGAGVGALTFVAAGAVVYEGASIGPGCIIGENAVIGRHSRLVAKVTVCHGVHIGERVLLHPGVVIGSDGFGLANDAGRWLKIPQLGGVEIRDDVEIGANTTVDRGALEDTLIEEGVKIDNQVQVGHNVIIGAHTAIAGCTGIAGSTTIGRRCMIGGACAIAGHINIADDVVITGHSGVTNSIRKAGTYSGSMATTDSRTWRRNMARLKHLDELAARLKALEEKLGKNK